MARKVKLNITLDERLRDALKIEAERECVPVSTLISEFAREIKRKQEVNAHGNLHTSTD